MYGKRMARVERERRQHGRDVALEVLAPAMPLDRPACTRPARGMWMPSSASAGRRCSRQQAACVVHHRRRRAARTGAAAARCSGRRADVLDAGAILLQQRRDAHHEELVEVGADDGEELDALEQGMVAVQRLVEDPLIELEPAQLAIDVQRWIAEIVRIESRPVVRQRFRRYRRPATVSNAAAVTAARRVPLSLPVSMVTSRSSGVEASR